MSTPKFFAFGPFQFFPETRTLRMHNRTVPLRGRAMDVFACLFENRHLPFVGNETLLKLWDNDLPSGRPKRRGDVRDASNVTQAIAKLSQRLREYDNQEYIETIRGGAKGGYRFVAAVTEIYDPWVDYCEKIVTFYERPPGAAYVYGQVENAAPWNAQITAPGGDLVALLHNQLREPAKLLLLGEYGTGKTKLCGAVAHSLAAAYRHDHAVGRVPILIPLRHLSDFDRINQLAIDFIQNLYGCGITESTFLEARRSGLVTFILDGLDEFLARRRETDVQFYLERVQLSFHNTSVLVTARPNVLEQLDRLSSGFTVVEMQLLSIAEAQAYLERCGLGQFLVGIPTRTAKRLRDLIRRPLFLEMVRATAVTLKKQAVGELTELSLFNEYVRQWSEREVAHVGGPFGRWNQHHVRAFLAHAAYVMTVRQVESLTEDEIDDILQGYSRDGVQQQLFPSLNRLVKERLLLVPDFSFGERRFSFRHGSLRSYFTACFVHASLLRYSRFPSEVGIGPTIGVTPEFLLPNANPTVDPEGEDNV